MAAQGKRAAPAVGTEEKQKGAEKQKDVNEKLAENGVENLAENAVELADKLILTIMNINLLYNTYIPLLLYVISLHSLQKNLSIFV